VKSTYIFPDGALYGLVDCPHNISFHPPCVYSLLPAQLPTWYLNSKPVCL